MVCPRGFFEAHAQAILTPHTHVNFVTQKGIIFLGPQKKA